MDFCFAKIQYEEWIPRAIYNITPGVLAWNGIWLKCSKFRNKLSEPHKLLSLTRGHRQFLKFVVTHQQHFFFLFGTLNKIIIRVGLCVHASSFYPVTVPCTYLPLTWKYRCLPKIVPCAATCWCIPQDVVKEGFQSPRILILVNYFICYSFAVQIRRLCCLSNVRWCITLK